jgi:hypothetical protein
MLLELETSELNSTCMQVLDMKFSDFKKAGYPISRDDLAGENQNPNGK